MIITNNFNELDPKPKVGMRVIADTLGNGNFLEYSITFIGKTTMKIRREDSKLEVVVKIPLDKYRANCAWWYERDYKIVGSDWILHFQYTKDEQEL